MQLTLRSSDPRLVAALQEHARRHGLSLNRAVIDLLARSLGVEGPPPDRRVGVRLDHLAGTWSSEEGESFDAAVRDLDAIDEELWR